MRHFMLVTSALILSVIIIACGGQNQQHDVSLKTDGGVQTSPNNSESLSHGIEAKIVDGKRIFDLNCKICHGVDGTLGLNGAKDLTISPLSLDEMVLVITKGRNTMTPFENVLSAQEITEVANYVNSLKQ